jgi:PAS domain-containing protein
MDECFFSFQYQPITDEKGTVVGVYEPFVDVTRKNHAARRMSLLLEISACSSVAKDISDFWRLLIEALDTSVALPFVMLYTRKDMHDTTSVAAVMLFEEEVRHREEVARQLDLRTKELLKSELKSQHMADNSTVGISAADPKGNITYANQAFYDITCHSGLDKTQAS